MILMALAVAAFAPSFDCAKVSTNVEKLICGDEQLARLDAALAAAYRTMPKKERRQERTWLEARNKCSTRPCLVKSYEDGMIDAIQNGASGVRHYHSRPNDGDLDILSLGDGWYAFSVVGKYPTRGGSWNFAEDGGSFRLDAKSDASRPPTADECGWRVQRLPGDRWQMSSLPPKGIDAFDCYGRNATINGIYSSRQRKAK